MTHCVCILIVGEQQQRGAVFGLPGFGGSLSASGLASLWLHAAAACVLPPAARAAATARRDVLLVGVGRKGRSSAVGQDRNGSGNETSAFHLALSAAHFGIVFTGLTSGVKCFRELNAKVIAAPHLLIPLSSDSCAV